MRGWTWQKTIVWRGFEKLSQSWILRRWVNSEEKIRMWTIAGNNREAFIASEVGTKKVLVTGASGSLGGTLCHALLRQGYSVTAFVRSTSDLSCLPLRRILSLAKVMWPTTDPSSPPAPSATSSFTPPYSSSPGFQILQGKQPLTSALFCLPKLNLNLMNPEVIRSSFALFRFMLEDWRMCCDCERIRRRRR